MTVAVFAIIGGVLLGLYYCLMSLGLNLSFGVLRVLNVAHGNFVVFGSYLAWIFASTYHISPLLAIPVGLLAGFVIGAGAHYAFVRRISRSADPEMYSLICFFGISQALEALTTQGFSSDPRAISAGFLNGAPVKILGNSFPRVWVVAAAVAVPVVLLVAWYLYRTRIGRATQALMSSAEDAAATGINIARTAAIAFGVSIALAAIAGPFTVVIDGSVTPASDIQVTTVAFAVIIIGGLGNPLATVLGGVVYGIAYEFVQAYQPSWSNAVPYVLLVLILLLRPSGILGRVEREA